MDDDLRAFRRIAVAFARRQRESADAGDARQCFAAKAHGRDGGEVFGFLDFAGGMAFEGQQRIVPAHAGAVVGDANQAASARLNFHGDAAGPGVERVFDEFLDHARGTIDHFAGGDLVGDLFRQEANAVHGDKLKPARRKSNGNFRRPRIGTRNDRR